MKGSEVFISLQQQQKKRMNERKTCFVFFLKVDHLTWSFCYAGTKLSVNKGLSFLIIFIYV